MNGLSIAVLIPCYNEELTIEKVVHDFKVALPGAEVIVCDNNSTDRTAEFAGRAGALVCMETLQGKGNAVRRMFADVMADVYVMVDGDDTYDAASATILVQRLVTGSLDMVNGRRISPGDDAYRRGHRLGNRVLTWLVAKIFGDRFKDMLSGYRVFSRRFVKSFPVLSRGFEIETELTVHALELHMPVGEVDTEYRARTDGSTSKLKTYRDGLRILKWIAILIKEERPMHFFGLLFLVLSVGSLIIAEPVLVTYFDTGLVPRLPTAVLATGMMILAFLSLMSGLILDTVTRGRRELKRLSYLWVPSPPLPPVKGGTTNSATRVTGKEETSW